MAADQQKFDAPPPAVGEAPVFVTLGSRPKVSERGGVRSGSFSICGLVPAARAMDRQGLGRGRGPAWSSMEHYVETP